MVDLPEPESPVNHSTAGFWCFMAARACLPTSSDCQWMLAARRSGCRIMPAPTVALVMRSIRMKAPVVRFSAKVSKAIGDLRRNVADADLVHFERLGRLVREVVDVDAVFELGDRCAGLVGLGAQDVGAAGHQRMSRRTRRCWRRTGRRHAAAAAGDTSMLPRETSTSSSSTSVTAWPSTARGEVAAMRDDALDPRGLAGFGDHHLVALRDRARRDRAGKAAEIEIGAVHILHREAERPFDRDRRRRRSFPDARAASGRNTSPSCPTAW